MLNTFCVSRLYHVNNCIGKILTTERDDISEKEKYGDKRNRDISEY